MLNVDGEKMSKSLGNFVTLVDVLNQYDPRAFRLLVLQTHYRKQMEVGEKELSDAEKAVGRIDALARRVRARGLPEVEVGAVTPFRNFMDDDFDTPAALAYVFELVRDANVALDEELLETAAIAFATVQELAGALGIELRADAPGADAEIDELVAAREAARQAKDWADADRIRAELSARGILVEDTPRGPEWRHE
jgi:cysteinyl-tRNA synthetase